MAQALNERGVGGESAKLTEAMRGLISPSADTRRPWSWSWGVTRTSGLGQIARLGGSTLSENTSDSRGGSAVGDYTIAEVNAELVRGMVDGFGPSTVRGLFKPDPLMECID